MLHKNYRLLSLILILCLFGIFTSLANDNCIDCSNNSSNLYSATIMQDNEEGEGGIISSKRIRIINLGPIVNSEDVDYAPTVSPDGKTLFYVSNRDGSVLRSDEDPSHDFWVVKKNNRMDSIFFEPYNLDPSNSMGEFGINTRFNEGAASLAADRQTLYFTACSRPDGLGSCDIYRTSIEGDKWNRPVNLGRNVNSKNWDSQPSISPDQSRIYFVSTRKGPNSDGERIMENYDIWYSDYDFDLEEWKPAKNLEAVNTPGTEAGPFIAADNESLFFSSNGHSPNEGGLDFYITRYNADTETWNKPENLGTPINTKDDEQFISLPASGDIIYFSSRREDLSGFQGNLDIFMAFVPTFFKAVNIVGTVVDECSGEFIPASVQIKNPVTGRIYTDSLTMTKTQFEMIVSNTDYGNPRDSIKSIDFEIIASNVKYGTKSTSLHVDRPLATVNPDEEGKIDNEYNVKLTLGQKPVLGSEIAEAAYIARAKDKKPELASFRGLVMEEVQTWDLYPLLNYVFFDIGSAKIPDRYNLFESPNDPYKAVFADTNIIGGTMEKYYHMMNIYGYRLAKYPDVNIEVVGCIDGETDPEKNTPNLAKDRATIVYNYLKDVWQIDESRMKLTVLKKPKHPSSIRIDTIGNQENRRVELLCNDWRITQPVFDKDPRTFPQPEFMDYTMKNGIEDALVDKRRIEIKRNGEMWKVLSNVGLTDAKFNWNWKNESGKYPTDEDQFTAQLIVTTHSGAECMSEPIDIPVMQVSTMKKKVDKDADSTRENYNLILFPFDRSDAGPVNERIMRDYVYGRVLPESVVEVTGHTDNVGLYEHNQKLSIRRSNTVEDGINKKSKRKYSVLLSQGVGEDEPLYDNSLPEGRFYNRTVQVKIKTPVEAWENLAE